MFRAKLKLSLKIRKFENGNFIGIHRVRAIYEFGEACKRPRPGPQLNAGRETLKKLASAHLWRPLLLATTAAAIVFLADMICYRAPGVFRIILGDQLSLLELGG